MKISTRSRYGLRLMLNLALNYGKGTLFLSTVADKENISEKYLSQIVMPLKVKGLVSSTRGAHGGYMLARGPAKITVKEIVESLEGNLNIVECLSDPSACKRISFCVTRNVWSLLEEKIAGTLSGITLQDLVKMCQDQEERVPVYNI
ncbi:MAG: Rrf2 family transcriptional regulator [Candidatus Omnitrophota bacterium]|nr:Rrf2 family transcriptional regulator [Candidatus Omnitrophota bacterium]